MNLNVREINIAVEFQNYIPNFTNRHLMAIDCASSEQKPS